MKKFFIFTVVLGFFFSSQIALAVDPLVYSLTSTTTVKQGQRLEVKIDCNNLQTNISQIDLYTRWSSNSIGFTFSIASTTYYSTTTNTAALPSTGKFVSMPVVPNVSCYSGTTTLVFAAPAPLNQNVFYVYGNSTGFDSIQASTTIYLNYPTPNQGSVKSASIKIYGTSTAPTPPLPPRPVTPPPEIYSGLVTRYSTTSCSGSATASTCVMEYVPEVYYLDWLLVNLFIIFLLSFTVIGFFMQRSLKS